MGAGHRQHTATGMLRTARRDRSALRALRRPSAVAATLAMLVAALLVSAASVIDTGVRTAEIGGLVEDCCACLAAAACLPDGSSEEECRNQYHPIGAMTNQLELQVDRDRCVQACPACAELERDYAVRFSSGTANHLESEG